MSTHSKYLNLGRRGPFCVCNSSFGKSKIGCTSPCLDVGAVNDL